MYHTILPHPQAFTFGEGTLSAETITRCALCGLPEETTAFLKDELPDIGFEHGDFEGFVAVLAGPDEELVPNPGLAVRLPSEEQGYLLQIEPDRVELRGYDAAGLWYGFQTLIELWRGGRSIECGEIRDWPSIRWRGIHLDLKGYGFHFDKLIETCHLLSHYKINAILLEVEDKFQYQCAPEVAVEGAYTKEQFQELSACCESLFIQVIPKLQALGHVDYILKHERFAGLREKDHPFQFCPRNEEAHALWRSMASELFECFPGHDFFHIGADETANLGECPICEKHSKADNYIHMVRGAIDHVLENGRQPIMWEDILRNAHGNLDEDEVEATWELGERCILNYWRYDPRIGERALPVLPRYLDRGMKVWGASAFFGAGPTMIENVPPLSLIHI